MKNHKTVLLLEDNEIEIQKVNRAFSKLGFSNTIISKKNGKEGLDWLGKNLDNLPGLILLDLNMPIMNGLEFLKQVKAHEVLKKVPVIIMTTSKQLSDKVQSFENHAAGYMVKPVRYSEFVEMLSTIQHYWTTSEIAY